VCVVVLHNRNFMRFFDVVFHNKNFMRFFRSALDSEFNNLWEFCLHGNRYVPWWAASHRCCAEEMWF
jgi:hypothetical protein